MGDSAHNATGLAAMRKRKKNKSDEGHPLLADSRALDADESKPDAKSQFKIPLYHADPESRELCWILLMTTTAISIWTRFHELSWPAEVVFDEVHFGKFASYYLRRTHYFDVHPPLGRLLIALWGWFIGYDGHFNFSSIGEDYIKNNVPHYALRLFPAICGALIIPLAFATMRNLRFSLQTSFFTAMLLALDNGLVTQSRFILLDSMLMLAMTLSLFSWVKFSNTRKEPFSPRWWVWLFLSGVSLGLVMGVKLVGLFTVSTIGIAVIVELWYLLDVKVTRDIKVFLYHFAARVICLIAVPISLYLLWFWIHFKVLIKTGPGDNFMSPEFQSTLTGNRLAMPSQLIVYGANVTLWHRNTRAYLHSHPQRYPLEYPDKRISSQGQQITGYEYYDINNVWRIKPADPALWDAVMDPSDPYREVFDNDIVVLEHIATESHLKTHDVASPLTRSNQEFTVVPKDEWHTKLNDTLFQIEVDEVHRAKAPKGERIRLATHATKFRLIHIPTRVAMYISGETLPEWGFKQKEVNGNKKQDHAGNWWYFDDVVSPPKDELIKYPALASHEEITKPSFFQKFAELQAAMIKHNARLTKPHPYQSPPSYWPTVWRGISFWQDNKDRQVYLLPNPLAYWFALIMLNLYGVWWLIEAISTRRGLGSYSTFVTQFHFSAGFLFLAWVLHYVPFYLMGRSLFLHHYLPAGIISFMLAGAMYEFILQAFLPCMREFGWQRKVSWAITSILIIGVAIIFLWFSPLSYGNVGLTPEQLRKMKWLSSWDFQYAG